jgi:hypothetical protein
MHNALYIKEKRRHTVETKRKQKFPKNSYTYMEKRQL